MYKIYYLCFIMNYTTIEEFPSYQVGMNGEIYSLKSEKVLKPNLTGSGYPKITLRKNHKSYHRMVHRIVAKAFLPNPDDKPCVNHKNGIKTDNSVNNLEWVTYSENSIHAQENGLTPPPPIWTGRFGYDHNRSKEVIEISIDGVELNRYGSASEAARATNQNISTVAMGIKHGNKNRQTGHYFKYVT